MGRVQGKEPCQVFPDGQGRALEIHPSHYESGERYHSAFPETLLGNPQAPLITQKWSMTRQRSATGVTGKEVNYSQRARVTEEKAYS